MKTQSRYTQLDYQERQTIAIARQQGLSIRAIARVLNLTVSIKSWHYLDFFIFYVRNDGCH